MQKRYCSCGHMVWVEYLLRWEDCVSVFWEGDGFRGVTVYRCAHCGRRLDINDLC